MISEAQFQEALAENPWTAVLGDGDGKVLALVKFETPPDPETLSALLDQHPGCSARFLPQSTSGKYLLADVCRSLAHAVSEHSYGALRPGANLYKRRSTLPESVLMRVRSFFTGGR